MPKSPLSTLKSQIQTLRDLGHAPAELRTYALDLIARLVDGPSLWYELGMVDGEPFPVRWETGKGFNLPLYRHAEERLPWPTMDPRIPPKRWNRSFLPLSSVTPPRDFFDTRYYERVWQPVGLRDQLRMTVYHGGEHVAWIGAARQSGDRPFSRAEVRRIEPIKGALADALITARRVEHAKSTESCDLLVDPTGSLLFASNDGLAWLSSAGRTDALREWVRAIDRGERTSEILAGHQFRWSRMYSASHVTYLVHIEKLTPVRIHPSFELSRTQREIAQLAAAGATAAEIASMRQISVSTAIAHLKQIYSLLRISSRAELGQVFADLPTPFVDPLTAGDLRKHADAIKSRSRRRRKTF